jgi:hypothetical protein
MRVAGADEKEIDPGTFNFSTFNFIIPMIAQSAGAFIAVKIYFQMHN